MRDALRRPALLALAAGLALLPALAGPLAPAAAAAAAPSEQPVQLSLTPVGAPGAHFELTMAAGETRDLRIELANDGSAPMAARTYAADAYSMVNGGFALRLRDEPATGTTTWLAYEPEVLALAAGETRVRDFAVRVPPGTPPGEYLAGISLENEEPVAAEGQGAVAMNQVVRHAVAVQIEVPGPLTAALATGAAAHKVAAGHSIVSVGLANTGSRHLEPSADVVLHDDGGAVVSQATVPMESVFAGTDTKVEVALAEVLPPGEYTVDLTVDDTERDATVTTTGIPLTVPETDEAAGGAATATSRLAEVFTSPDEQPVAAAALAAAAAVLLAGVGALLARRRRRANPPAAPAPAPADDWDGLLPRRQ